VPRFNVTVSDETSQYGAFASVISSNTLAAANLWAAKLTGQSEIEISVVIRPLARSELAFGGSGPGGSAVVGTIGSYSLYQFGAAYELQTGIDPNGAAPDIVITVNGTPSSFGRLWFDPTPQSDDGDIPASSSDAVSVFVHEIGHGLGFNGWRDHTSGALSGGFMSTFDRYVEMRVGQPYFIGPNAMQAYGGPVPLTRGNLMHLGNRTGPGEELVTDVMSGVGLPSGRRLPISALDLAILQDTGLDIRSADIALRGSYRSYLVSLGDDRQLRITDLSTTPTRPIFYGQIGPLRFADGSGLFDPTGNAARIARLYGGALGRKPDASGLEHHVALINAGTIGLDSMARAFLQSPEFISRFGVPDNAGFVTRTYANVLARAPDPVGGAGWAGALAGGLSREAMLLGFTESVENRIATLADIGDGNVATAYRLYRAALAREPDRGGLANWTDVVDRGVPLDQIARAFLTSPEFAGKYGALGDAAFVTAMYRNALGRLPDAEGQASWTQALAGGLSRAALLVGFSDSTENRAATATATHDGWVFAR